MIIQSNLVSPTVAVAKENVRLLNCWTRGQRCMRLDNVDIYSKFGQFLNADIMIQIRVIFSTEDY